MRQVYKLSRLARRTNNLCASQTTGGEGLAKSDTGGGGFSEFHHSHQGHQQTSGRIYYMISPSHRFKLPQIHYLYIDSLFDRASPDYLAIEVTIYARRWRALPHSGRLRSINFFLPNSFA